MNPDIRIWEIDRSSRAGTKLRLTERVETEEMLEAVLVANPDMLISGLTLVGRQVPVETGFVDLLGIDEDGRLVVFELKREKLTRAAVAAHSGDADHRFRPAERRFQAMPITLEGRSPHGEREALAPADRGYRPRRRGLIASGSNKLPPPGMGPGDGSR